MYSSCGCYDSQSLINLFLTSRAISNVWDNDKDVSGLSKCYSDEDISRLSYSRDVSEFSVIAGKVCVDYTCIRARKILAVSGLMLSVKNELWHS